MPVGSAHIFTRVLIGNILGDKERLGVWDKFTDAPSAGLVHADALRVVVDNPADAELLDTGAVLLVYQLLCVCVIPLIDRNHDIHVMHLPDAVCTFRDRAFFRNDAFSHIHFYSTQIIVRAPCHV